ncbi:MAG: hypothetical protein AB1696_01470 [Planctomycetota bacterium]
MEVENRLLPWAGVILLSLGMLQGASFGKPLDMAALPLCGRLRQLMQEPLGKRRIADDEAKAYVKIVQDFVREGGSSDAALCATLLLAFAGDNASHQALMEVRRSSAYAISGAALYALRVRASSEKKPEAQFQVLCDDLRSATEAHEKMFLANRIAVDFGEASAPIILSVARSEPVGYVKCDMLYYLAQSSDVSIAKEILTWKIKSDISVEIPESLATIMLSITPGRPNDRSGYCWDMILQNLAKRLGIQQYSPWAIQSRWIRIPLVGAALLLVVVILAIARRRYMLKHSKPAHSTH